MQQSFQNFLSLLTGAYARGELVPFLGAGMSSPGCVLWDAFVENLEATAGIKLAARPSGFAARANQAVRMLRRSNVDFASVVRTALRQQGPPPEQTCALATIWWPLILTTNYDNFYELATQHAVRVVGRSLTDCREVLSSLRTPAGQLLWALQGYLEEGNEQRRLADELVIGHDQYRRVTYANPYFRTTFAEVFRTRSLLFLGSSLQDSYLLDLFSETLEKAGSNPVLHFALVKRGSTDVSFLRSSLNIVAYEYEDHSELPSLLYGLREAIDGARPRTTSWHFATNATRRTSMPVGDLQVTRSVVPPPGAKECVVISCGYSDGSLLLSDAMADHARADQTLRGTSDVPELAPDEFVAGGSEAPYFYVAARDRSRGGSSRDKRDLRVVGLAMTELLTKAEARGFEVVRSQLLAAGRQRTFPPIFSLMEMIRSYGEWRRTHQQADLKLAIHVVDPSVIFPITTHRIDIPELLSGGPMRFWIHIAGEDTGAQLAYHTPDEQVTTVAAMMQIPIDDTWACAIEPSPSTSPERLMLSPSTSVTLRELGVVSFSTVRFEPL